MFTDLAIERGPHIVDFPRDPGRGGGGLGFLLVVSTMQLGKKPQSKATPKLCLQKPITSTVWWVPATFQSFPLFSPPFPNGTTHCLDYFTTLIEALPVHFWSQSSPSASVSLETPQQANEPKQQPAKTWGEKKSVASLQHATTWGAPVS